MRRILAIACALQLALPGSVLAAPKRARADDREEEPTEAAYTIVARAEAHWREGEWSEVRSLLEPLVATPGRLEDPLVREKALVILADATINDETLSIEVRRQLAGSYLTQLMEDDADWRLPGGIYSPALFELYNRVREDRGEAQAAQCVADRNACLADLSEEKSQHNKLERAHAKLEQDHAEQEVEVREQQKRSRAWALIPLGVGHFYNGDIGLGIGFLVAEVGLGAAGITLIAYRTVVDGCTRTAGFAAGSLQCQTADREGVKRRRQFEEGVGWFLLGTFVLDIVLAQIFFKDTETTSVRRVKRKELDAGTEPEGRKQRKPSKRRAKVRPAAGPLRGGAGVGLRVRF